MAQLVSLSDEDLAQLRTELAAGRSPMVWFTTAAVGVAAGGSAKIMAFDESGDGDFIQVRPTGSKDVLAFSPSELTRTRPPRRKAGTKPARAAGPPRPAATPPRPVAAPPRPGAAPPAPAPSPPARAAELKPAAKPAARRAAKAAGSAEVTLTLASSANGEWTVEVVVGKKRTVRPTPVSPAEVAKAARELPAAVGQAVDRALDSARKQQQDRVETLRAELERAQRALKDLG